MMTKVPFFVILHSLMMIIYLELQEALGVQVVQVALE